MNVWVKRAGIGLTGLLLAGMAAVGGVWITSNRMLNATWDVPTARIEHPWPFDDADLAALHAEALAALPEGAEIPADPLAGRDLSAVRTQRARERGAALAVRLGCKDCHGEDLGGRTVMDVPPVMGLITPNITNVALGGEYTIADFERIVRHGVRRDGSTSFMPAIDYERLSDREISDLFEYVVSAPAVDRPSGRSYWGPVLRVMYTLGSTPALSAHRIDHQASHPKTPPTRAVTVDYGRHLAQVCRGCHREDFRGGPMAEGDPSWPPAANLTPHESGLKTWTSADFVTLMRTGKRPDGRDVDPKGMPWPSLGQMDDVDLQALFVFLQSLPAQPTGT